MKNHNSNRRKLTPEEATEYDRLTRNATQITLFDMPSPVVYGYIRVSSKGQAREGYSLEAQEAAVRSAGATEIVKDVFTGVTADRPALDDLLSRIQPGDTLIATKFDRIARSLTAGIDLINELSQKGVKVIILEFGNICIDDSTIQGTLIRNIMLTFAQYEHDLIVQRMSEGKEIARQNPGWKEGRPKKYSQEQITHALTLLSDHSYSEVEKMTGISKSTLIRSKKKESL